LELRGFVAEEAGAAGGVSSGVPVAAVTGVPDFQHGKTMSDLGTAVK
jgi:2-methylisocitrate lyase-like PEP mutase family enzyme